MTSRLKECIILLVIGTVIDSFEHLFEKEQNIESTRKIQMSGAASRFSEVHDFETLVNRFYHLQSFT